MGRDRKKEWEQLSGAEKQAIEKEFNEGRARLQAAMREMQGTMELQQNAVGQLFKQSLDSVGKALSAPYEQSMAAVSQTAQHVQEQIKADLRRVGQHVREQIKDVSTKLGALLSDQIEGFLLYEAVAGGEDEEAQRILASENFGLPVIKFMLHYASLSATERLDEQRKLSSELDTIVKAMQRKNEARTQAARETRKENSLIPDIEARLQAEDKIGNLGARDLARKVAKEFNVSSAYVQKIRRNFLATKSIKSVTSVK